LTLLDHKEKPFCTISQGDKRIGFRYAFARECRGYDPIMKEVVQKSNADNTETIFEELRERGETPILKKQAEYEDKPKNEFVPLEDKKEAEERGKKICIKCVESGYFQPRGEVHPAHDWHSLWNMDFNSVAHSADGVCLPKSMAYQSQPEGGPNQFDTEKNRVVKDEK